MQFEVNEWVEQVERYLFLSFLTSYDLQRDVANNMADKTLLFAA
jgi:hypothetical protein